MRNFLYDEIKTDNLDHIISGVAVVKEGGIACRTLRNRGYVFSRWISIEKPGHSIMCLVKPSDFLREQYANHVGYSINSLVPANPEGSVVNWVVRDISGIGSYIVASTPAGSADNLLRQKKDYFKALFKDDHGALALVFGKAAQQLQPDLDGPLQVWHSFNLC